MTQRRRHASCSAEQVRQQAQPECAHIGAATSSGPTRSPCFLLGLPAGSSASCSERGGAACCAYAAQMASQSGVSAGTALVRGYRAALLVRVPLATDDHPGANPSAAQLQSPFGGLSIRFMASAAAQTKPQQQPKKEEVGRACWVQGRGTACRSPAGSKAWRLAAPGTMRRRCMQPCDPDLRRGLTHWSSQKKR